MGSAALGTGAQASDLEIPTVHKLDVVFQTGSLGLTISEDTVSDEFGKVTKLSEFGKVTKVVDGGQGHRGGVKVNDIVFEVDSLAMDVAAAMDSIRMKPRPIKVSFKRPSDQRTAICV